MEYICPWPISSVVEIRMPDGEKPVIPPPPAIHIERTLALIKPDAIHKSDEIEEIILQHGFTILQVSELMLNYVYNLRRNKTYKSNYM